MKLFWLKGWNGKEKMSFKVLKKKKSLLEGCSQEVVTKHWQRPDRPAEWIHHWGAFSSCYWCISMRFNIKINLVDLGPNFGRTDIRGYERSYNKKITDDWLMESSFSSHLNKPTSTSVACFFEFPDISRSDFQPQSVECWCQPFGSNNINSCSRAPLHQEPLKLRPFATFVGAKTSCSPDLHISTAWIRHSVTVVHSRKETFLSNSQSALNTQFIR